RQRTSAGVFERLSRGEPGLLADHAGTTDVLYSLIGVGDDPVARHQLGRDVAAVQDADRIGEQVPVAIRIRLVRQEARRDGHRELVFGHGLRSDPEPIKSERYSEGDLPWILASESHLRFFRRTSPAWERRFATWSK